MCAPHRLSLRLQQPTAQDAARTAVHESSGDMRSRKAQRQALPDNSESGDTYNTSSSKEEKVLCGEKVDNGEHQRNESKRHRQPPPPATRQQHSYWVELLRVCRLAVVAAAAACCFYCDEENPPPAKRGTSY